jgi:hypothetical protein
MVVPTIRLLVNGFQLHATGEVLNSVICDGMPTATRNMWDDSEDEDTEENDEN